MIKTLFLSLWLLAQGSPWLTNMQEAKALALRDHRHILLNFSGSDWCGPCIVLRKQILDAPDFSLFADTTLVLVDADFPRMKKHQLSKEQQALNEGLADRYNTKGQFPLTLLLTAEGRILRQWEGNPDVKPAEFVGQVKAAIDADR
jgi:hypothetical protein